MNRTINFTFIFIVLSFLFVNFSFSETEYGRNSYTKQRCHSVISEAARKLGVQSTKIKDLESDIEILRNDLSKLHNQIFAKTKLLTDTSLQLGLLDKVYTASDVRSLSKIDENQLQSLFIQVDALDKIKRSDRSRYENYKHDALLFSPEGEKAVAISAKGGRPYLEKLIRKYNSLIDEAQSEMISQISSEEISKRLPTRSKRILDQFKKRQNEKRNEANREFELECNIHSCDIYNLNLPRFTLGTPPKLIYTNGEGFYSFKDSENRQATVYLKSSCQPSGAVDVREALGDKTYHLDKDRCEDLIKSSNDNIGNRNRVEYFKLCTEYISELGLDLKVKPSIKTFSPGPVLAPPTTR